MGENGFFSYGAVQILDKLRSYDIEAVAMPRRLKKDILKLMEFAENYLDWVELVWDNDATNRESVKRCLVDIQNLLYDVDEDFDNFSYEILRRKAINKQPIFSRRRRLRDFASSILFRSKILSNSKKIEQCIHEAGTLVNLAHLSPSRTSPVVSIDRPDRVPISYSDGSDARLTVREREMLDITKMLQLSSSTPSLLTVVSIVGLGGSGKTTLASMVFQQVKKLNLFDERLWVCVSQTFEVKRILKEMLAALDSSATGLNNVEAILRLLESKLKDKRFLLVLDDVWETDSYNCDDLIDLLRFICSRSGNFVIVTTRNSQVATAMRTKGEHVVRLKDLEDDQCWDIIRETCVKNWGGPMPQELEVIGREIAKKCQGIPLAAKVVAATLCNMKTPQEWSSFKNNDAWDQTDDEPNQILGVLKLSFLKLFSPIRQCLVYCSLFPKDFECEKDKLIQLWMAEGFLDTAGPSVRSMEDIGDEYLDDLIAHSLSEVAQLDSLGNITSCKMHDIVHDLAMSVSNYRSLKFEDGSTCFVRTFNFEHPSSVDQLLEAGGSRNVRSFICKGGGGVSHMFSSFKSLRSLDLSNAGLKELPSVIVKLKQLKYLDISYNKDIKELPEFITMLYNLQTLRLIMCWRIEMLPANMVNLLRLRHIHFDNPYLNFFRVGCLTELRTLPHFKVREEKGFGVVELKTLNELRGKLSITSLQNVRNEEVANGAILKEKKLIELCLEWERSSDVSDCNDKDVLECLHAPSMIKRLTINGYSGNEFPKWMSMGINDDQCRFTELMELSLSYCRGCEKMPSLGHLPRLKILEVSGFDNIKSMGDEFYGECRIGVVLFSELKKFSLRDMKSLRKWGAVVLRSVEVFPVLKELSIEDCPRLTSIPLRHLSSLTQLSIARCEDMKNLSDDSQHLSSLDHLMIRRCRNLVSLSSLRDLRSLKKLRIEGCVGLTSFPQGLVSLETLEIHSCGLAYLRNLSIRELGLGPFSGELEDFPGLMLFNLPSVEKLALCGWPRLKSLPEQLQQLTALKKLSIVDFKGLETLPEWLDKLSSLQQLILVGCDNLKIIPKTTLTMLTNLTKLECHGCPLLKERYNKYTGPDRRDISHIEYTYFDSKNAEKSTESVRKHRISVVLEDESGSGMIDRITGFFERI